MHGHTASETRLWGWIKECRVLKAKKRMHSWHSKLLALPKCSANINGGCRGQQWPQQGSLCREQGLGISSA